jgi:hypothetical protein
MNHLREMIQDDLSKKNFDAPSLERVLRGRVCYSHTRRITSKKAQHGAKRHSSEESSGEETDNSKESSSRKTSLHSQRKRKKRKHSKSHDPEEFKKSKPPTFDGEMKKGEEA